MNLVGGGRVNPPKFLVYPAGREMFSFNFETKENVAVCQINPKRFSSTVVANGNIYVIGGTDSLTAKFGDKSVGTPSVDCIPYWGGCWRPQRGPPRLDLMKEFGSCVVDQTLYAIAGFKVKPPTNTLHATNYCVKSNLLDPNPGWTDLPDHLNLIRGAHSVCTIHETIFALGGIGGNDGEGEYLHSVESLNTTNQVPLWQDVAPMTNRRARFGTVTVDGKIYAIGGENKCRGFLKAVELYDPVRNLWFPVGELNVGRRGHGACAVNGRIYAIGGNGGKKSLESFDPREANGKWELGDWGDLCSNGEFSNAVVIG